jgi:hypothetical protein
VTSKEPEVELAETFAEIARVLLAEVGAQATLGEIMHLAVQTVDACEHAGVSIVEDRKVSSAATSDDVPAIVDRLQTQTGEGPCLDAIKQHDVFYTGRLSKERRWPQFSSQAHAESGVESILAFRLFADGTLGALNLYSTRPDAFDDHDIAVGAVFAAHSAVAWSTSRTIESLKSGMTSGQMIGQAIGMLRARQNLSEEEAFDVLRRASQRMNVKLRSVAEQIVTFGDQPATNE